MQELVVVAGVLVKAVELLAFLKSRERPRPPPTPEDLRVTRWKAWARERNFRVTGGDVVEGVLHGWPIRVDPRSLRVIVGAKLRVTREDVEARIEGLVACTIGPSSADLAFARPTSPRRVEEALERLYHLALVTKSAYR